MEDSIEKVEDHLQNALDAHKTNLPGLKVPTDVRQFVAVALIDEGLTWSQACRALNISRPTLWADFERYRKTIEALDYLESREMTADRVNRRSDLLYSKAMQKGDLRLALDIETKRLDRLESLGLITKAANDDSDSMDNRTKQELVEAIQQRIAELGITIDTSAVPRLP